MQSLRRRPPPVLSDAQEQQKKQLLAAAEDLDKKLQTVESRLVSQALRNSDDKYFVEPYGAYLDLIWLNAEVGTGGGDVAGSADFAPSETQLDLLNSYEAEVAERRLRLSENPAGRCPAVRSCAGERQPCAAGGGREIISRCFRRSWHLS